MRPLVRLVLLFAIVVGGCRCDRGGVGMATSELEARPSSVDFGRVAIGASVGSSIELRNLGTAPGMVSVSVSGDGFAAARQSVEVPGGATVTLDLTFAPTGVGPASGAVVLSGLPSISLAGEGLPACAPKSACHTVSFETTSRSCADATLPDGTACSSACLESGTCRQGECVGTSQRCSDSDPCTVDSCGSDGGCSHAALTCPIDDPCKVGVCDPASGCTSVDLVDGTRCGDETCEEARICLGGQCTVRQKPDAVRECRYTQVARSATGGFACGLTVSGRVRCWGASLFRSFPPPPGADTNLGLDFQFAFIPPTVVPRFSSGAHGVGAGSYVVWAAFDGGLSATTGARAPDAGLAEPIERLACNAIATCAALFVSGRAVVWEPGGGQILLAAEAVRDVGGGPSLVFLDGGTNTADAGGAARAVVDVRVPHVLLETGAVTSLWPAGAREVFDGGVVALSAWDTGATVAVCGARAGGLFSCRLFDGREVLAAQLPEEIVSASQDCVLTASGRIWCPGGDVLPLSLRPIEVAAGVDFFAMEPKAIAVGRGESVRIFGRDPSWPKASVDGGPLVDGSAGSLAGITRLLVDGAGNTTALTDAGLVYQWRLGVPAQRYGTISGAVDIGFHGGEVVALSAVNELSWRNGLIARNVRAVSPGVLLFLDGGVAFKDSTQLGRTMELPAPAVAVSDGCLLYAGGRVECLAAHRDGGFSLVPPAGLWPVARQVVGTLASGCILYGQNGVQCWGENMFGQLGTVGPASSRGVSVAVPEPVERLSLAGGTVCAHSASKRLLCWGDGSAGQLGFERPSQLLPVLR